MARKEKESRYISILIYIVIDIVNYRSSLLYKIIRNKSFLSTCALLSIIRDYDLFDSDLYPAD